MAAAWPYLPSGAGPSVLTLVHSRVDRFKRYNPSSCRSSGRLLVSPPHTIRTLPTPTLACPTLGPGTSPLVSTNATPNDDDDDDGDDDEDEQLTTYRSFLTEFWTSPPNTYRSPFGDAIGLTE